MTMIYEEQKEVSQCLVLFHQFILKGDEGPRHYRYKSISQSDWNNF
jgi:hypothetical protein